MNENLLGYIPTQPVKEQPQGGARKYTGETATGYDAKRASSDKWKIEQAIIEDMLADLPEGATILDAPVGTGRFFDFYERKNFIVRGIDISADMLREAAKKVKDPNNIINGVQQWAFAQTSVLKTGMPDSAVEASVMCRLTRWLSPEDCQTAFQELQRVTKDRIILTARVANHPHMRPVELFESVLQDGWTLKRNEQGCDQDYRVLMFRRQQ